ncbi:MAG: Fic family protein [Burkholderiales bacterium]
MIPMQSTAGKTAQVPEGYLAYFPNPLPPHPDFQLNEEGILALTNAEFHLGKLAQLSMSIPNPDLFVGMYVRREAILSSEIENISCTLDEVLRYEVQDAPRGTNKEIEQIVNYVRAFNEGLRRLQTEKLTSALLRDLHGILLEGYEQAKPGSFRDKQNWIGRKGASPAEADFVPPPQMEMYMGLGNLEYFINEHQSLMPALVRCAIAHAQFETIHPFADGNGRIGRLLIALMLCQMKKLERPFLYLSLYLLENKTEYYTRLTQVRSKGDWQQLANFMLLGVELAAKDAIAVSEKIVRLQADMEKILAGQARGVELVRLLYRYPIITARGVQQHLKVSLDTAISWIGRFEHLQILREITGQRRGRVYRFDRYVDILDAGWTERRQALAVAAPSA